MALHGLSGEKKNKKNRRKWARYERDFSNSMWHTDRYLIKDPRWAGRWLLVYEDDASRMITGFGVFDRAASANAVGALRAAIAVRGRPASVMSDRGSQFYATDAAGKGRKGAAEFEIFLAKHGIRHVLAGVGHPQTNGKIERLFGEFNRKSHLATSMADFVRWWNEAKIHESLDMTPARAYLERAPPGGVAVDEEIAK